MRETPVRIGPYEIIAELASGGMATTFIASKRGEAFFERLVVLKRIHPWLLEDPKSSDMLRDEARLAGSILHAHVVHVEDVVNHEGEVCLVMPYVESLSLGALLKFARQAGERMPGAITSRILMDVLSGLHAAHEAKDLRGEPLGIVHRDVSPSNILVGTEGQSRIIDFGIARATSRLHQTNSRDMKGTIAYMSPEQLRRRELDRRADVFAAGAILYEMLTGERLFDGRDEADILIGVLADDVPSICSQRPEIGPDVDVVLAKALARDREERFSTARELADALEAALAPASPREVSEWVGRFGKDEFARRRAIIRAGIERQDPEVTSLGADSRTTPPTALMTKSHRIRENWKAVIGAVSVITAGVFAARTWLVQPSVARNAVVYDAPTLASVGKYSNKVLPTTQPVVSSNQAPGAQPSASTPVPLLTKSTVVKPLALPVRSAPTVREKLDNERSSELQENPYR